MGRRTEEVFSSLSVHLWSFLWCPGDWTRNWALCLKIMVGEVWLRYRKTTNSSPLFPTAVTFETFSPKISIDLYGKINVLHSYFMKKNKLFHIYFEKNLI